MSNDRELKETIATEIKKYALLLRRKNITESREHKSVGKKTSSAI